MYTENTVSSRNQTVCRQEAKTPNLLFHIDLITYTLHLSTAHFDLEGDPRTISERDIEMIRIV